MQTSESLLFMSKMADKSSQRFMSIAEDMNSATGLLIFIKALHRYLKIITPLPGYLKIGKRNLRN